jgi:leucine dehydrogenase
VARNSGKSLDNPMDDDVRKLVYLDYGEFMTKLSGAYITAEDVGTTLTDMATIFSKTRFTTCIPAELGFYDFLN